METQLGNSNKYVCCGRNAIESVTNFIMNLDW